MPWVWAGNRKRAAAGGKGRGQLPGAGVEGRGRGQGPRTGAGDMEKGRGHELRQGKGKGQKTVQMSRAVPGSRGLEQDSKAGAYSFYILSWDR